MIHRLTIVYATISTSIGIWLRIAARGSAILRSAMICASDTAITWPTTIANNDVYHVKRAPNIGIVGARFTWYTSLFAIVVGHVIAVSLAHIIALRNIADPRAAMRSQIPMLVLMVAYTMVSLWIIAQPIVE